eukprot:TRINITY_DN5333_c0_g1_i2.p1 TRINITY_DN5333_c0_g1~~TRINITY_DN5333_c0_g1_i2.p1  ORF type:complete len:166 (+),score=27.63 TRINITY_DN5333_c0_g1_i2:544-1041(+)
MITTSSRFPREISVTTNITLINNNNNCTPPHNNMKIVLIALLALAVFATIPAAVSAQDTECSFCKLAVQYVEGYLAENATEAQIEKYFEVICKLAPSQYTADCDAFITQYLPTVIRYLNANVPPSQVCSLVGLCSSSSEQFVNQKKVFKPHPHPHPQPVGKPVIV